MKKYKMMSLQGTLDKLGKFTPDGLLMKRKDNYGNYPGRAADELHVACVNDFIPQCIRDIADVRNASDGAAV